ncbi:hypothetical protein POM88_017162 [Heracleum sosnowskyi]|uniref:BHLH domain-containing protein n=1 Tax=Heracleum sosnowskyi TaxID=360622 RepID=A0AAD8MXR6_9APIA|nr:hypothetical protein POM88_017162 [Heracleum sosnowskyi]
MDTYFYLDSEQHTGTGSSFDDPYSFHSSSSSLLGFPSFTDHKPPLPLFFDQTFTSVSHPFPVFNTSLISNDFNLRPEPSLDSVAKTTNFKVPKTEPEETDFMQQSDHISNQASLFQLPDLRSLEENVDTEFKLETQSSPQLDSPLSAQATHLKYVRQRDLARQRRQRVRERIESLKELLPTHKKQRLDTAMVLENACKYVKFLEAQVKALKAMPVDDCLASESESNGGGGLNRNRVLQMLVNSEVSQGKMSSEGMCVYSVEQLLQIIGRLFTIEEASVLINSMLFSSVAPL